MKYKKMKLCPENKVCSVNKRTCSIMTFVILQYVNTILEKFTDKNSKLDKVAFINNISDITNEDNIINEYVCVITDVYNLATTDDNLDIVIHTLISLVTGKLSICEAICTLDKLQRAS